MDRVSREWPWSHADDVCVLLLDVEQQWGLNCSEAPSAQFTRAQGTFRDKPVFARRGSHYRVGSRELSTAELLKTMSAAAHVDERGARRSDLAPGHPWLVVGSLEGLRANHPAFEDASTEEWISVALHEFAHARQLTLPSFEKTLAAINAGEVAPAPLAKLYTDDASYHRLVEAEYAQLVAAAWADPYRAKAKAALASWLEAYEARTDELAKRRLVTVDSLFTYIEGVARYVESEFLVDPSQHPPDALVADPLFREYAKFEGGGYARMSNKQLDPDYTYAIGFHLCVLLDRIDPAWKQRVHDDPEYVIGQVRAAAEGK